MPCSNCSRCETSLLLMPFPNCKLVLVQWQGVRVQHVQDDHHEQGAGEHRDGPEDPHEQRGGEVERPEPHGPEVAAPDDMVDLLLLVSADVSLSHFDALSLGVLQRT